MKIDEPSIAQAAERATMVQKSRDSPVKHKELEDVSCAARDESDPAAVQGEPYAATKWSTRLKMDDRDCHYPPVAQLTRKPRVFKSAPDSARKANICW